MCDLSQNSHGGRGKPANVFTFFLSSSLPTIFSFVPFLAEQGSEYKVKYYPTDAQASSSDQYFEVALRVSYPHSFPCTETPLIF